MDACILDTSFKLDYVTFGFPLILCIKLDELDEVPTYIGCCLNLTWMSKIYASILIKFEKQCVLTPNDNFDIKCQFNKE